MFKYTKAVCRKIPRSIVTGGLRLEEPTDPVDYDLATQQHEQYVDALKKVGITSITLLETDETVPDCVFVEDTALVIGNTVLITNPGAQSRRPEVQVVKEHFQKEDGIKVVEMNNPACADGGDILFTGREIFVGQSKRTNEEGIKVIQETFPVFPVHPIRVNDGTLHLKSLMSMAGERTIVCGESDNAIRAKGLVISKATVPYDVITVPCDYAANCLFINGVLVHRSPDEYPTSCKVFHSLYGYDSIALNLSELDKVDGALTCCSLLY